MFLLIADKHALKFARTSANICSYVKRYHPLIWKEKLD